MNTSDAVEILDLPIEAGVDAVIGVDPVQGVGTDMREMRATVGDRLALWGGVNSFVTVELGSDDEIREAVALALEDLGPRRTILSPVDNIRDESDDAPRRAEVFVEAWKELR